MVPTLKWKVSGWLPTSAVYTGASVSNRLKPDEVGWTVFIVIICKEQLIKTNKQTNKDRQFNCKVSIVVVVIDDDEVDVRTSLQFKVNNNNNHK